MKIGIILTPDIRSKAYLQKIITNNILLDEIIFMNDNREEKQFSIDEMNTAKEYGFNFSESVKDTLTKQNIKFKEFNFVDINHDELLEYVKQSKMDYFIFTGGGILRSKILNVDTKFIHFHPGIVPDYRGSTCYYYSIINEDKCGVTSFIMNEGLDTGPIVHQKIFQKPNHVFIDEIYDSYIRSETLLDVLKNNMLENEIITQDLEEGNTYFIIHPVLKHIAILSCIK